MASPPRPADQSRTEQVLRAIGHIEKEEPDQAVAVLRRVLTSDPTNGHAHRVMSNAYLLKLQREPALYHARLAFKHAPPGDAEFLFVLGRQMRQIATGDETAPIFARAVETAPFHVGAWVGWTEALMYAMRFAEASEVAERGRALHPQDPALLTNGALALENAGRAEAALELLRGAAHLQDNPMVSAAHATCVNHSSRASSVEVFEAHRHFGKRLLAGHRIPARPAAQESTPDRALRVGFLSADLRSHAVSNFFEPLLRGFDRRVIEPICYSTTHDPDQVTARLRGLGSRFVDLPFVGDDGLLRVITGDRVDILIEMNGLTAGQRLPLLRHRPAPLIGTYLGYPATTGVPLVDFRIVDEWTDPLADPYDAQAQAVERLLRLPRCFVVYQPPQGAPAPFRTNDRPITFGSFNMHKKINDDLIALWAKVLARVPGSRLLVKNYALASPLVRDDLAARLQSVGVEPSRLLLLGPESTSAAHLARYADVDVALDSHPYNGTTTTCEALFMGVPVVTLIGDRHASRVGFSLLSSVGRAEWCARTPDEYVELAATLASGPTLDRAALRDQLTGSPVCDGAGLARAFEGAVVHAWQERATLFSP